MLKFKEPGTELIQSVPVFFACCLLFKAQCYIKNGCVIRKIVGFGLLLYQITWLAYD